MNKTLHILFTTGFLVVIFTIYNFAKDIHKEHESEMEKVSGRYFIQIDEASWGDNCTGKKMYKYDKETKERKLYEIKIRKNNAIMEVSRMCNNKETCSFKALDKVLDETPAGRCQKRLTVKYRCFDIDRLRTITGKKRDKIFIDCREKTVLESLKNINK